MPSSAGARVSSLSKSSMTVRMPSASNGLALAAERTAATSVMLSSASRLRRVSPPIWPVAPVINTVGVCEVIYTPFGSSKSRQVRLLGNTEAICDTFYRMT